VTARVLLVAIPLAVVGLLLVGAPPATAQTAADLCNSNAATADQTIASCTQLIASGALSGADLANAYYDRGIGYQRKGQDDLAIADYTEAVRIDPNNALAYYGRGLSYRHKGQDDLAIADYTQALRIAPTSVNTLYNRGLSYTYKTQYDLAIADYSQALQLDPNYTNAYFGRGYAYQNQGRYDLAIGDYTEAIRIDPNDTDVYNNRGRVYRYMGQPDLAIADYSLALRIDPNSTVAYTGRGNVYQDQGQTDLAIADYTQALRVNPNLTIAYADRGAALLSVGRFADAGQDFAQAVSLDPAGAYAVLWLHVTRMRAGVDDTAELAGNAAHLDPARWPGPVLDFYSGKTNAAQMLAIAAKSDQLCEAQFYLAEWQLAHQQGDLARTGFQQAARTCPMGYLEHGTAQAELRRLTTSPQPAHP
jgi:tetratricopeptide (TPR) repeat protein